MDEDGCAVPPLLSLPRVGLADGDSDVSSVPSPKRLDVASA